MTDLAQKVRSISNLLFGNRITLVGATLYLAGLGAMHFSESDTDSLYAVGRRSRQLGGLMLGATVVGFQTITSYRRAKRHIEKNNGFDERYLRTALESDRIFFNYCPDQGVYLAAKETGHQDEFEKARQKYSVNMIPHF